MAFDDSDDSEDSPEAATTGDSAGVATRQTPLTQAAIDQARATITDELLGDGDRPLVELLESVQQYVDNHEYVDRAGNAFVERLVEEINNRNSLRRLLLVGDQEVFVIIGAEGWAEITNNLEMNDREAMAVRDAHHTYAEMRGLEQYVTQVNIMCIRMYDDRLREFLEQIEPEHAELSGERLESIIEQLSVSDR